MLHTSLVQSCQALHVTIPNIRVLKVYAQFKNLKTEPCKLEMYTGIAHGENVFKIKIFKKCGNHF